MLRIGLTGGIASGKSTVAEMLLKRGAHVLHADTLAHELYEPGKVIYEKVVEHFGREILDGDGCIDREKLANVVFPGRIAELNAIVHPAVIEAQKRWMDEMEAADPHGIAVVEAALLIEAGAAKDFHQIIVVTCDFSHKVAHFAKRAGVMRWRAMGEVERRSAAQMSDEDKAHRADFVVDNSGRLEDTERQVEQVWHQLQAMKQ